MSRVVQSLTACGGGALFSRRLCGRIRLYNVRKFSDMSAIPEDQTSDRPWMEMATSKEDREAFYYDTGFSFRNSTYPVRYVQDPEKRVRFMRAYFKYLFENDVTSGKATLGLLKKRETVAGKREAKIIFGGVIASDTTSSHDVDSSELFKVDPEAAEITLKREKWMQDTIHSPMRQVAASMGTVALYISHRATMEEYKGKGYGAKYSNLLAKTMIGKAMPQLAKIKKPPIIYLINSDTFPSAFKVQDALGVGIVGHYHFRYKSGLKCYLDPLAEDERDICCTFLYTYKDIASRVREKLKDLSPAEAKSKM